MTSEQRRRVEELYDRLDRLSRQERAELLDQLCPDDRQVREEVESLLAERATTPPPNVPNVTEELRAAAAGELLAALPNDPLLGASIGPYRILEKLGDGGMGSVYKAEQRSPVKRIVALKIIKAGVDTREVIARFSSERQALARMDHPNIAKVLDAGSTDRDRPYFVMEYVPGMPITRFADENKLSIKDRLLLFIQVCDAIAHAHTKAIIHRDIKASNVLGYFDDQNQHAVKVIDFGIAKALTNDRLTDLTFNTAQGLVIGSYESMSPEQAAGSPDIDTRTDVYSLGALLYELLTGAKPFGPETFAHAADEEIRRMIREVEPPRPSNRLTTLGEAGMKFAALRQTRIGALAKQLLSELEWIPLKAMRKERGRRYESPLRLAEDVGSYLNGLPLIAGPESQWYRFRKLVRRYRWLASGILVITVSVAIGASLAAVGYATARNALFRELAAHQESKRAQRLEADQRRLAQVAEGRAESARREAEINAYAANLEAARLATASGDVRSASRRLEACPGGLRDWEWGFVNASLDRSYRTVQMEGAGSPIAVSRDGRRLAASHYGKGRIILLHASDGTEIKELCYTQIPLPPLAKRVGLQFLDICFSADAHYLAAVFAVEVYSQQSWVTCQARVVAVWDCVTGELTGSFTEQTNSKEVASVRFDVDDRSVLFNDSHARLRSVKIDGQAISPRFSLPPDTRIRKFDLGRDGDCLAYFDQSGDLWLLRGKGDGPIACPREGVPVGQEIQAAPVVSVDAGLVSAGLGDVIYIWRMLDGKLIHALRGSEEPVAGVAFSPDGKLIASVARDFQLRLWDTKSGRQVGCLTGHKECPWAVVFHPSGKSVFTAENSVIKEWGVEVDNVLSLRHSSDSYITALRFDPQSKYVATASWDGTIALWEAATGVLLAKRQAHLRYGGSVQLEFAQNGSVLVSAAADGFVHLWSVPSLDQVSTLWAGHGQIDDVAVDEVASHCALISRLGTLAVWSLRDRQLIYVRKLFKGNNVEGFENVELLRNGVRFSSTGSVLLATCPIERSSVVLEARSGAVVGEYDTEEKLSPLLPLFTTTAKPAIIAGRVTLGNDLGFWPGIELRPVGSHAPTWGNPSALLSSSTSLCLNPTSTRLFASARNRVQILDLRSGQSVMELRLGSADASALDFSPDGKTLAVGFWDGTVKMASGVPVSSLPRETLGAHAVNAGVDRLLLQIRSAADLPEELIEKVAGDLALADVVRTAAIERIRAEGDYSSEMELNSRAWGIVRSAHSTLREAQIAESLARRALKMSADAAFVNTLGVAQYRQGRYRQALWTLIVSDWMYGRGDPANIAFLAMAHQRLGHKDDANRALQRLRKLMRDQQWEGNGEAQGFLAEAEALIAAGPQLPTTSTVLLQWFNLWGS